MTFKLMYTKPMLIPNKDDLESVTKFPFLLEQPVLAGLPSKGKSVSCKEM